YFHSMKNYKLKMWLTNKHEPIELLKRIRFDINENLIIDINGDKEKFILKDKSLPVYKGLKQMKQMLLNLGVLHYDDAYYLAMKYININPNVVKLLQKRFSYVFVDEMQDMDFHQYQLLEKVFSDANMEGTSFQRLGDNNQAIYNNKVNSYAIWESRDKVYTINGSNRLTRLNAKLASRFSIDNSFIEGININDKEYKPVLLVYDEKKVECSVIKSFSEYLNELFEEEKKFDDIIYKVVSWRRNHKDKISLSSYCPKNIYMRGNHSSKESLINKNFDYYKVTQILIEKIVGILNKADIKLDNQDITKFSLINYLNDMQNGEYEKYKLSIYRCVNFLFNKEYQTFYQEFKKYLEQIVALLDATNSQDYLLTIEELEFEFIGKSEDDIKKCEECDVKGNSPIVDSVHSVKGETHDVTLFLESFYNSNYESDILHEVLCGKTIFELIQEDLDKIKEFEKEIVDIKSTGKDRGIKTREDKIHTLNSKIRLKKQYAKMVYVALTRSKSVVGYGINANKYNVLLKDHINTEEWNIIFVE
ncbi:MAG: UvrD-helicase domain-containing protein, partial [Acholeplasma sp.]|nr:UvrD-helicase domain-containing protein [Acholeplasma sp.]